MSIFQDIRFAQRQLLARPGFTLVVVITFALGIGATTAIFSLINSIMLKPLPYSEPQQLVHVFEQRPDGGNNTVSGGAYKDWAAHSNSFQELAIYEYARMNLTGSGEPQRIEGLRVSANYLSVLGVQPLFGRGFVAGDDTPAGNNRTVLLTHELWQRQFAGGRQIVGKHVVLDDMSHAVIGVLPPGALMQDETFLVPAVIDGEPGAWTRSGHWRNVIGRLQPNVTPGQAQAELRAIKQRMTSDYPSFKRNWSIAVVPTQDVYAAAIKPTLLVLFATVICVLLIACSNVSNLMLVRGSERGREMSLRSALGASTGRLLRQLLVESVLLALLGCAAGLLLAIAGIRLLSTALVNMLPYVLPHALHPQLDGSVLAFSILLAVTCGLLFGLLPAVRAARSNPASALKENERGSQGAARKRSQFVLLATQFAFTLVLLIGAGLMLRSFALLLEVEAGFQPRQALAFDVSLPAARYPDSTSRTRVVDGLLERIETLPGVDAVGVTSYAPLSNRGATEFISRADQAESSDYVAGYEAVAGDYLAALGVDLLRGRFIESYDNRKGAPRTLIINERIASDLFPRDDPLGKELRLLGNTWQIVGVVGSVRHQAMHVEPAPRVYSAYRHSSFTTSMVLRATIPPSQLMQSLRVAIDEIDSELPVASLRTLEDAVHDSMSFHRTTLLLLGLFALLATTIACVGIHGVTTYVMRQRERELGIRAALGAGRRDLGRLVMYAGLGPSLLGAALGMLAAFILARYLESLLFVVDSRDPLVFAVALAILLAIAVIAILVPAWRAAHVEPMQALRQE